MSAPIFIVGNPRSGTTMFRLMLAAHSKINIPPESEFIVRLYQKYGHIQSFKKEKLLNILSDLCGDNAIVNLEEQWQISLSGFDENIERLFGKSYAEFCESLYIFYAHAKGLDGKAMWGDKNNAYGNYVDVLTDLYPQAKFIHIVRDGRAVLSSYQQLDIDKNQKYAPLLPKDPVVVAENWVDMVDRIDRHLQRFASGHYITVRYEDILDDFELSISKVCDFLGVNYEHSMKLFHQVNIKHLMEPVNYSWKENTRKPLDRGKATAWRERLSPNDICRFESVAASKLVQHGYKTDTSNKRVGLSSSFHLRARFRESVRGVRRFLVVTKKTLGG